MRHLSSTQLLTYANCPRQYYFHYIEKITKPTTSPHLVYGGVLHKALEEFNKSLIAVPLTEQEVIDVFEKTWEKELNKSKIEFKRYSENDFKEMGKKSLIQFFKHINYEPMICYDSKENKVPAVEYEFTIPVINIDNTINENYCLFGVIDLIAQVNKNLIVFDHKTSKDPYDDFKIQTSIQLILYAYACRDILSRGLMLDTDKVKEDYVAFNIFVKDYKKPSPRIQQCQRRISDDDITNLHHIILSTIRGIENDVFIPNYGQNCFMCDYREECLKFKYKR